MVLAVQQGNKEDMKSLKKKETKEEDQRKFRCQRRSGIKVKKREDMSFFDDSPPKQTPL